MASDKATFDKEAFEKVVLSFSLTMSEPYNISISHPERAESLKLVATVRQESSPFPDRAVTLLTSRSFLDNDMFDAFYQRLLGPPTDVNNDEVKIYMHALDRIRCTRWPFSGARDMRQREDHVFVTVPPLGQGGVDIVWSLCPQILFRSYMRMGDSLEERLREFTVGQRFKIEASNPQILWWTWGSLQHDLKDKQFSHWSLPKHISIIREAGEDEGDKVDRGLIDHVDRNDLDTVIRQWNKRTDAPFDAGLEEPPKVREMREKGWVFGEWTPALKITCDQTATFEFVE